MNYKNQLQEYAQKNKLAFPIYNSFNNSDISHIPKWSTQLIFNGKTYQNNQAFLSKKNAEQDIAKYVCQKIFGPSTDQNIYSMDNSIGKQPANIEPQSVISQDINLSKTIATNSSNDSNLPNTISPKIHQLLLQYIKERYIFIVDLENMPLTFSGIDPTKYNFHFYLSSYSTVDPNKYNNLGTVHIIQNGQSEATDHLMTYHVAKMSCNMPKSTIFIIISRDKSSSVLADLLKKDGFQLNIFKSRQIYLHISKMNVNIEY